MTKPDAYLGEEVARLKKENLAWTIRELQSASQPHAKVDGKDVLVMCTNNYLNLSTHPKVVNAMIEATKKWGAGAGAVPVLSGNTSLQQEFEKKFAKFKGVEASLLCQTGFAVNAGLIPQLVGKGDLVISDRNIHSSLIYQGVVGELGLEQVAKMNAAAMIPDLVIWIDCDPAKAMKRITTGTLRMAGSNKQEYFEAECRLQPYIER